MTDLFAGLSMAPAAAVASPTSASSPSKSSVGADGSNSNGFVPPTLPDTTSATAASIGSTLTPIPATGSSQRASSDSVSIPNSPPEIPPPSPSSRTGSAPVTDKLLGLLGPTPAPATPTPTPATPAATRQHVPKNPSQSAKASANSDQSKAQKDSSRAEKSLHVMTHEDAMGTFSADPESTRKISQDPLQSSQKRRSKASVAPIDGTKNKSTQQTKSATGVIHPETPVPNADVALRLFRKLAKKTQSKVPEAQGGTQKLSIISYLFGSSTENDIKFKPYAELMKVIVDENDADEGKDETDRVVESVMGKTGDTAARARKAVAAFCHLMSIWGHASSHLGNADHDSASHRTFTDLLASAVDTATALVTHGCLDDVLIGIGPNHDEYHKVVDMLAESVFVSDVSMERNELAAMKFLLSTGCRITTSGEALLRGSHLLQSIRVLYHVYLTTEVASNRTTARASLQQLVTSVFVRMITSSPVMLDTSEHSSSFPTENHRDAFLVLRSLCKLSMRGLPHDPTMHSHVGLQASGSNSMWDAKDNPKSGDAGDDTIPGSLEANKEHAHLLFTQAIHPALESKVLALDMLLYILQHTNMTGKFLRDCGPQFHFAIRNYLCVSLLKNCTSDNTHVVNLSLRVFVPIIRNFRSILKAEIEAFVTNVFFVILESKNSPVEHKSLVVTLFEEICSDPTTLAEIFLNYDCDLSAVDLFHRIVNSLSKVARTTEIQDDKASSISFVTGAGAARMEKIRNDHRELRLDAMRALRQILASLHASIVEPMPSSESRTTSPTKANGSGSSDEMGNGAIVNNDNKNKDDSEKSVAEPAKQSLVQIYDSKKKKRAEESEVVLRFGQKPSAGIAYAGKCGHLDANDPADVARYLLKHKDMLDKTQIGEYLGREPEYQNGFSLKVLHEYVNNMDFAGLLFDDAIRYYLSGFRLPGEAQKIDRIMEKFAERYTAQNPDVFPTADVAFILAFSIIMLNTDLHNPAIKEERRMTKQGFIRNNRGICDGQDLPQELLTSIFDRIKSNPISLKEDDEARERQGEAKGATANTTASLPSALSPAVFFNSHYDELDRTRETNFHKERDQIVRTTESLLKRRRHPTVSEQGKPHRRSRSLSQGSKSVKYVRTEDSGLRDEYVSPMFEVTWGPTLAAFSTALESANGTVGALLAIATDEELELAAENAAETIEVCLTGFRFAICTAGLCSNDVARDAFMLALTRFTQLGTGILLEPRHVRCIQTLLQLARQDGELLGSSWEHVFKSLSEVNRFHQLFHLIARNDRAVSAAADRRKTKLEERQRRQREREARRQAKAASDSLDDASEASIGGMSEGDLSVADSELFIDDDDDFLFEDEMDKKAIDEANARIVYDAVSESLIEAIYERSSSLSTEAVTEFIFQLCRVSRMEISHYGGQVGSNANTVDLTQVHYRQHHTLLLNSPSKDGEGLHHHHQPNIYNLQKLVEVTHYNMDSRPRLVFAELWTTVAAHLTSTALHSNPAVAMYAVDSFRQLCIQYLQREELGVFEFQRRFLKPLETVMARSELSTTKELLLKCVDRIILMFGSNDGDISKGMLRSGWRPVLTVLGLAGRDPDEAIAKSGFAMLTGQLQLCLAPDGDGHDQPSVLLAERFVDLVDALLMYVSGPHDEMSLTSIDHLVKLSGFLSDESFALPLVRRRSTIVAIPDNDNNDSNESNNQELELWWPILLGVSRAIGDNRKNIRMKSLESLLNIITTHFFPIPAEEAANAATAKTSRHRDIQTLQLVFRGILTPVLEFGEVESPASKPPQLPDGFELFITTKSTDPKSQNKEKSTWLDSMFDIFMDGCVSVCLQSIDAFGEDTLIEEIFAMLNTCLLSDSGALAVRGLRRIEQFVGSELKDKNITDDTWATLSHMLRKSLAVRGLPKSPSASSLNGSSKGSPKSEEPVEAGPAYIEEKEAIREFIAEDNMLSDRRYVGSNATMVIGSFLGSERFEQSLGLRWRLFLITGLGRAIRDWEYAASLLAESNGKNKSRTQLTPNYIETAYFGRKCMNRFLLQLASMKEVAQPAGEGGRASAAQTLIKDQTQQLVTAFLDKEDAVNQASRPSPLDTQLFQRLTSLIKDLLAGYDKLPEEHIQHMAWLNSVLSSCIHTSNESIRLAIQKLVKKLH